MTTVATSYWSADTSEPVLETTVGGVLREAAGSRCGPRVATVPRAWWRVRARKPGRLYREPVPVTSVATWRRSWPREASWKPWVDSQFLIHGPSGWVSGTTL